MSVFIIVEWLDYDGYYFEEPGQSYGTREEAMAARPTKSGRFEGGSYEVMEVKLPTSTPSGD